MEPVWPMPPTRCTTRPLYQAKISPKAMPCTPQQALGAAPAGTGVATAPFQAKPFATRWNPLWQVRDAERGCLHTERSAPVRAEGKDLSRRIPWAQLIFRPFGPSAWPLLQPKGCGPSPTFWRRGDALRMRLVDGGPRDRHRQARHAASPRVPSADPHVGEGATGPCARSPRTDRHVTERDQRNCVFLWGQTPSVHDDALLLHISPSSSTTSGQWILSGWSSFHLCSHRAAVQRFPPAKATVCLATVFQPLMLLS